MSKNCHIGYINEDSELRYVYCHWDGDTVGDILVKYYATFDKVKAMVDRGAMSSLGEESEMFPLGHSFYNPIKGYTVYYVRDRGESKELNSPRYYKNFSLENYRDAEDFCDVQMLYVYDNMSPVPGWFKKRSHLADWIYLSFDVNREM